MMPNPIGTVVRVKSNASDNTIYHVPNTNTLIVTGDKLISMEEYCDKVLGDQGSQSEMADEAIRHLESCLSVDRFAGFLVFGPTKSGKTHTLFGHDLRSKTSPDHGLLPKIVHHLMDKIKSHDAHDYKLNISAIEVPIYGSRRDLLDSENDLNQEEETKIDLMKSSPGAVLEKIRQNRSCTVDVRVPIPSHRHTLYVLLRLERHEVAETYVGFMELANENVFSHFDYTHAPVFISADQVLINSCLSPNHDTNSHFKESFVYQMLKGFFTDYYSTLVICCVSSIDNGRDLSMCYISLCGLIREMSCGVQREASSDMLSDFSPLMESLSLVTKSEDNTQSALQLECIEEVTESEEEIASSNGEMSQLESADSPDNSSLCESESESESDRDGIEAKTIQSDSEFSENLENFCAMFNVYTDSLVDTLQSKAVQTQTKEHKCSFSGARRGGLSDVTPSSSTGVIRKDLKAARRRSSAEKKTEQELGKRKEVQEEALQNVRLPELPESEKKKRQRDVLSRGRLNAESPNFSAIKHTGLFKETEVMESCSVSNNLNLDIEELILKEQKALKAIIQQHSDYNNLLSQKENSEKKRQVESILKTWKEELVHGLYSVYTDLVYLNTSAKISAASTEELAISPRHQLNKNRFKSEEISAMKAKLNEKIKNKTASPEEEKEYMICEEILSAVHLCNDYLNTFLQGTKPAFPLLPDGRVGELVTEVLRSFKMKEVRRMMMFFFLRITDLRENLIELKDAVEVAEGERDYFKQRFEALQSQNQELRVQNEKLKRNHVQPSSMSQALQIPSVELARQRHQWKKLIPWESQAGTRTTIKKNEGSGKIEKIVIEKKK